MSSNDTRTTFKNWLTANAPETVLDMTAEFEELQTFLTDNGIGRNDDWVGLQFIGAGEDPIGLSATNSTGCYRETGSFFLHFVTRARRTIKARDNLLPRIEAFRNLLRGRRINDIIITGVTPPNFESGATLEFEGGYQAATFTINYYRDINL